MKKIKKQILIKQIICIIITLMLCNFIIPNYSFAALDPEDNNKLLEPLAQALCFIPDMVIEFLQKMFVSSNGISEAVLSSKYEFLYSPGTIFAGKIPAFDINFIGLDKNEYDLRKFVKERASKYIEICYRNDFRNPKQYGLEETLEIVNTDGRTFERNSVECPNLEMFTTKIMETENRVKNEHLQFRSSFINDCVEVGVIFYYEQDNKYYVEVFYLLAKSWDWGSSIVQESIYSDNWSYRDFISRRV